MKRLIRHSHPVESQLALTLGFHMRGGITDENWPAPAKRAKGFGFEDSGTGARSRCRDGALGSFEERAHSRAELALAQVYAGSV